MDDEEIVQLYLQRRESAIIETENRFGRLCYSIAFNILCSHEDAQECENDAYLAAWNTIPPVRPIKLCAYLGRLVRNIALDKYDYNKAKKRNGEFATLLTELSECITGKDEVHDSYEKGQIAEEISQFLRKNNTEYRNIFIRRYWFGDPISKIAMEFQISESKVKSVLFRMRNKLKKYLEKDGIVL